MKIIQSYPPNFEKIREKFDPPRNTVFAYGDTIFAPDGVNLSEDLIVHESVHCKQQGGDIDGWWKRYMEDEQFRLSQEVEAYREQYKFFKKHSKDRNSHARFIHRIAGDLCSGMYGSIISYSEAINKIK